MEKTRAPTFAQLCAIARRVLPEDPRIDDFEWRERVKDALVKQRLAYPQPHDLSAAMDRVAQAVGRTLPQPEASPAPTSEPHGLTHEESVAALSQLRERFGPLPAMKPRTMPSGEPELMNTRERYHTVALIEQLRELRRQQRERAATPPERADEPRAARRDGDGERHPAAEGKHEIVRPEGMG